MVAVLAGRTGLMMQMNKPGLRGLPRLAAATRYSFRGIHAAWRCEEAFRLEAMLAIVLVPSAFWLGEDLVHQMLLIASCVLVLIVELINSSIEAVVDRVGLEHHPLSGQVKDLGSAAVFLSMLLCGATWILSLWQHFSA